VTPYYYNLSQLEELRPNSAAKTVVFCEESGYHYYYANSASGQSVDGETVLDTGNGGNTRWIAVNALNPNGLNINGLTADTTPNYTADYLPIYSDSASANRKTLIDDLLKSHPGVSKAWVNFDGTSAANVNGTYYRSGTTVTVTYNDHGYLVGHVIYASITSGSGTSGLYTITGITTNTFTYTEGSSGSTSGNVTLLRRTIRNSYNVHSVTYANAAGQYITNYLTALTSSTYCITGSASPEIGSSYTMLQINSYGLTENAPNEYRSWVFIQRYNSAAVANAKYVNLTFH